VADNSKDTIGRLAKLAVEFGANLQPGQILAVQAEPEQRELALAIAATAYSRGARFVDVQYFDPYVKRARIAYADDDTLDFVPSWYGERVLALGEQRCARIWISGPTAPGLLDDLDPARAGRDILPRIKESGKIVSERTTNWTIVPYATAGWARQVHPELAGDEALNRLREEIVHICRLDEPDPVAAWNARIEATGEAAERLNRQRFDALHFEGPGTDLTIGLLPSSIWANAMFTTVDGVSHLANVPTEEVFTCPDPERADGFVRATKPLVFADGGVVSGLRVRFEGGRAVAIDADEGAENLRARCAKDDGGSRLGEVALVDREGRVGPLGTIFFDTLLDENAASHIALGDGFDFGVTDEDDRKRLNRSGIHIDFMLGGPDVSVTGITTTGERLPVLVGGDWQI
jgi:aminopeptidase